jgi:LysM repeat protein
LGCHRKKSRIRIPHRLPIAAAAPAAVAGVAAAFALSPQALAATPPAHDGAHHAVVAQAAKQSGVTSAQLLSAIKQTAVASHAAQHSADQPSSYTVQPGDSLSSIAGRVYHNQGAWPVLYWANQSKIQWADVIQPGQVLSVPVEPSRIPSAPSALGPAPAPAPETSAPVETPSVSQDSAPAASTDELSAPAASTDQSSAPAASTDESSATEASTDQSSATEASSDSGGTPGGAFGQCVVSRESGGNAQVMNSSGHYGLYQFSASTWAEYGGNPADFGNASVAEQNQVFANALAAGGESNWAPYDGC